MLSLVWGETKSKGQHHGTARGERVTRGLTLTRGGGENRCPELRDCLVVVPWECGHSTVTQTSIQRSEWSERHGQRGGGKRGAGWGTEWKDNVRGRESSEQEKKRDNTKSLPKKKRKREKKRKRK